MCPRKEHMQELRTKWWRLIVAVQGGQCRVKRKHVPGPLPQLITPERDFITPLIGAPSQSADGAPMHRQMQLK